MLHIHITEGDREIINADTQDAFLIFHAPVGVWANYLVSHTRGVTGQERLGTLVSCDTTIKAILEQDPILAALYEHRVELFPKVYSLDMTGLMEQMQEGDE